LVTPAVPDQHAPASIPQLPKNEQQGLDSLDELLVLYYYI